MIQELRSEVLVACSKKEEEDVIKLISEEKVNQFASIDTEDLKLPEFHQKISLTCVDSIHARFQDSFECIKPKIKSFIDSAQGDISLCLFDSIFGGKMASQDQTAWSGKDFKEALTFAEVSN